ncbi:MAG: hypothetical protein ND895_22900 [Pyrinomonadaceae bacterium]|nr:hypothetical protein [Pyrinomonadaceae bacterium]
MKQETDELTPQELELFAGLEREKMPPPFLENRIVEQLKGAGVIRTRRLPGYLKIAAAFALLLAVFSVGAIVGARRSSGPATKPTQAGYILIVREFRPELRAKSLEEERLRVKEYGTWARDLGRRGLLLGGEKLKDEGRLLSQPNQSSDIVETSSGASEGATAGYFLLPAVDYNQAVTIARTCPHIKHGGTVELRQIDF